MAEGILMITAISGAEECATVLAKQFQTAVETASGRKEGLVALKRREYAVVVVDESLMDSDDEGSETLLKRMGLAIPLEMNFAISGCGRLVREVRSALHRREREQELAAQAVATAMQSQLRDTVAGLLLQSELALAEPELAPSLVAKLKLVVELAGNLRQRLNVPVVCSQ